MATTTYYPDPSPETTSVDGQVYNDAKATWTLARDATSGDGAADSAANGFLQSELVGGQYAVHRFFYLFDTSGIPDTDVISSATLGVMDLSSSSGAMDLGLIQTSPASNTALATGDFDAMTVDVPAEGATRITPSAGAYCVFTLNATGISWISKTGVSKFGVRMVNDIDNTQPATRYYRQMAFAETTGTTSDPYLTVTYAAASGPSNLKSYNTNVKSNIKSIDGNLIANIKSLDTNA